jgi:glycosyltransferase involved in cell wall biosynthesis
VELVIWHGYLLADTGSNIYTQHIARAWGRMGHRVRVLAQDRHPERYALGERVSVLRPEIGPLLPVFVVDRYDGVEARHVADFTPAELDRYVDANAGALRAELERTPAALVLANHAIMGGPVALAGCAPSGTPYAVKVHGSELEYAIRGRPRLAGLARAGLDGAAAVYAGSRHIEAVTRELIGDGPYLDRLAIVPPGVDVDAFAPGRGSLERLRELLQEHARAPASERRPDPDAADRLAGLGRFALYFGKLLHQKGVHLVLEAWERIAPAHPDATLVVVGFGSDRAALEGRAPARTIFTGAMSHEELQLLVPLADVVAVPSVLPEAFGMVAAEAAACGVVPVVADHSGLREVAEGLGDAGRRFDGTVADLARELDAVLSLDADERARIGEQARRAVVDRWSWESVAGRLLAAARAGPAVAR